MVYGLGHKVATTRILLQHSRHNLFCHCIIHVYRYNCFNNSAKTPQCNVKDWENVYWLVDRVKSGQSRDYGMQQDGQCSAKRIVKKKVSV